MTRPERTPGRTPAQATPSLTLLLLLTLSFIGLAACADRPGSVPEVPAEELSSEIPELEAVHEIMAPLWHEAFPDRDFAAIREATPQFAEPLAALDAVELPGILRDRADRWNEQKRLLFEAYEGLKNAAEADDDAQMLGFLEAFHMNYEGLVRIVRPVVPELEDFHQHLYGLYHYYGPGYDLEKIGRAAEAMAEALGPLSVAQLPERLADRQAEFEAGVGVLREKVTGLQAVLEDPSRSAVEGAIEEVHSAYEAVKAIFE